MNLPRCGKPADAPLCLLLPALRLTPSFPFHRAWRAYQHQLAGGTVEFIDESHARFTPPLTHRLYPYLNSLAAGAIESAFEAGRWVSQARARPPRLVCGMLWRCHASSIPALPILFLACLSIPHSLVAAYSGPCTGACRPSGGGRGRWS